MRKIITLTPGAALVLLTIIESGILQVDSQRHNSFYSSEVASLTPTQRNTLKKLRNNVENLLTHDFMKEDLYLVRFLKSKNFVLRDTINAVKEAVEWRKLSSMDEIDHEDFSYFESEFPLYVDGVDRQGRVIMEAPFGSWPVRTAAVSGRMNKLKRYGERGIELSTRRVRELQEKTGSNVTQWVMLLNLDGFNVIESACPSCLPYYLNFISTYEKYYPYSVGHMVYVNTPDSFQIILNLVRPLMSAQTRKVMKIFGTDKSEWKPYVDKYFAPEEIPDWSGGYKVRNSIHK